MRSIGLAIAVVCLVLGAAPAQAQVTTAFQFGGRLTGINPTTGVYDLRFRLMTALTGGTQIGAALLRNDAHVTAGEYGVSLDFGDQFAGQRRWVQIEVRPGASTGAYTTQTPRQELLAVPYTMGLQLPLTGDGQAPTEGPLAAMFCLRNVGPGGYTAKFATTLLGNLFGCLLLQHYGQGGAALTAYCYAVTGLTYGLLCGVDSPNGYGIAAYHYAVLGIAAAILGQTFSGEDGAIGVFGRAEFTKEGMAGATIGVEGLSNGTTGRGVLGLATATSGINYGVRGETSSASGYGGYFVGKGYFSGNLGVGVTPTGSKIAVSGGATCSGTMWVNACDVNLKENFAPIDPRAILERVASLPISSWSYKSEGTGIVHVGPTAQDFRGAFGLGDADTAIGTVDADGVALAAIQGLNAKAEERDVRLAALRDENARVRAELDETRARVRALEEAVERLARAHAR